MELTIWPTLLLLITLSFSLAASLLFLLNGKNKQEQQLPPGPPALLFLAKFLALGRSIFDLGPLLLELHARYGPVISVRLFRTLVFVSDRHLAHRVLVQSGSTFADRPRLFDPGLLFTSGSRNINAAPYGAYWRLVRRNLASEALHPARVSLFAPARRRMRDALVRDLLARGGGGDGSRPVTVRTPFRNAMFELLVYMSLGASGLAPEVLDEIQELQLWVVRTITGFPVFSFFPALTKRLFRKRWAAHLAVRRRQDEIFLPFIQARSARAGADEPPCYADSLLARDAARGRGGRPRAHGLRASQPLLRVPERRDGQHDDLARVDHGGAGDPSGDASQGVRRSPKQAGAQRKRPSGDAIPEGRGAGGPAAAPAGALPPPARRPERPRSGDRRLQDTQRRGGQLPGGRVRARRGGVDGGGGVPAGAVPGRRRRVRRGHHGEQGDQDDAFRRGPQDVPWVHARLAAPGVLRGGPREGAPVAAGGGGGGGGHDGDAGFHHPHEAPPPCSHRPKGLMPRLIQWQLRQNHSSETLREN